MEKEALAKAIMVNLESNIYFTSYTFESSDQLYRTSGPWSG